MGHGEFTGASHSAIDGMGTRFFDPTWSGLVITIPLLSHFPRIDLRNSTGGLCSRGISYEVKGRMVGTNGFLIPKIRAGNPNLSRLELREFH